MSGPRLVDLTLPLSPGQRGVAVEPNCTIARDGWNAATWRLYSHAATHMDSQIHFGAGPETTEDPRPAAGTADWFSASVHPHEPALRAFLSRRFTSLPDYEDIVQETYVRVLRACTPRRLAHIRALLFTMALNVAIDHVRRRSRAPIDSIDETSEPAMLETAPDAAERCDLAQRREAIMAALETLPKRCREVMFLRYVDGFTANEIAMQLGLAAATVRVHLMKGVRDCARFFRARGLLDATEPAEAESWH